MAREWLDEDDRDWEPLLGERPTSRLARHPSGDFVAMQVSVWIETTVERAAVWETRTRKIAWNPGDANALAWLPDGEEILVLRECFAPNPSGRGICVTPLQSDCRHSFERRSWPSVHLIALAPIDPPTGWLIDVVPSPDRPMACVVWQDQCEAGIDLISWEGGQPAQFAERGYYGRSNLISGPAFSPDGRYVAISYGEPCWWSEAHETPSKGGDLRVGCVVVGDIMAGTYREIDIVVPIPKGWLPTDPDDIRNELLNCPHFVDGETVQITTPTGVLKTFSVIQWEGE
jgi:dipeptidyl aminopeptidase/acylaminoacyl peptidase